MIRKDLDVPRSEIVRDFYLNTEVGRSLSKGISRVVTAKWNNRNMRVVCAGVHVPLAIHLVRSLPWITYLVSDNQMSDLSYGKSQRVVVMSSNWPISNNTFDAVLIVHSLEMHDDPCSLIREAHRVLNVGGELIIIAANRYSLWAYSRISPFCGLKCYGVHGL
mgnify:FL=1